MRFLLICFILFFSIPFSVWAQNNLPPGTYTSSNKKAIKYFLEGRKYYESRNDIESEKCLQKAVETDPAFTEAHMLLGNLYVEKMKMEQAIIHYKKAVESNAKLFPITFYQLACCYIGTGKYSEAKTQFENFLSQPRIHPELKEKSEIYLKSANFGVEAMKNPKPFNPVNLGQGINSEFFEYFPAITADGKTFLFTRNLRTESDGVFNGQEDFYISEKVNNTWQLAAPIRNINSSGNEGAPTLSADGQFMFYTSCADRFGNYGAQDRKGMGSCDIFYSQNINKQWTKPINIGSPVNSGQWETQPSFSSDGKTLYFIRGFQGRDGLKHQDIYMTAVGVDGKFGEPVKLGPNINTPGQEESVYIHPDNMTLYFSSDGHTGMGGLDIFMSKRQSDGSWGPAINLGYPINTWKDENSLLVDPAGKIAYFASDRSGGFGGLDIYSFELPQEYRPEEITYVKGKVFDAKTSKGLDASFELIDLSTQQQVLKSYSAKDGNFLVTLTANKNYLLNVSKNGYLYYSDNFSLKDVKADYNTPFKLDVPLQPIDTGYTVELKNVFFDVDKFDLKPESKAELEKLILFLKTNPNLKIELGGHTDNTGDKKKNQLLSQNRAKAVYDYLIQTGGIEKFRLSYFGYGDSKPKVPNDSPEHKQMNRRTEFRVKGI